MHKEKPKLSTLVRMRDHFRRRFLLGLFVVIPFGFTGWVLVKFVNFIAPILTKPTERVLEWVLDTRWPVLLAMIRREGSDEFMWWVQYPALAITILITLAGLYTVGLLSATFFGRRYIAAGERFLWRIPGAEFVYNTIKQVVEILSKPRSQAFHKVVLIDYPRKGIRGLAFFSGITVVPETGEVMLNVFIPTTPNPTSGFLLLMEPDEVLETNITVSNATRFVISGGVVELENLELRRFPIEDYEKEIDRQRRRLARADELDMFGMEGFDEVDADLENKDGVLQAPDETTGDEERRRT